MASKGQTRSMLTRLPAAMAAMAVAPRPLTAVCSRMLPTAVMEYCKPMGKPIFSSFRT